jgi:hypothetical protein
MLNRGLWDHEDPILVFWSLRRIRFYLGVFFFLFWVEFFEFLEVLGMVGDV